MSQYDDILQTEHLMAAKTRKERGQEIVSPLEKARNKLDRTDIVCHHKIQDAILWVEHTYRVKT